MKPILEVRGISKKYKIGTAESYLSLRDNLVGNAKKLFSFAGGPFKKPNADSEFWALKDVSFDVMPGESVGIIGRNGAGKSTLLKILSKITPPTEGYIKARGRVASLLEVGTGFHPELTGRENIYLNGSILGLRKWEIDRKFDEIVGFSGVEKFLDTTLKHYSSGMQLRLAFSVAAHLEPEILVIDEVLAVGDAEFQKKCLGKMDEVSKSGRTVLFVSHQMEAVRNICAKSILLQNGQILTFEESAKAITIYLNTGEVGSLIWLNNGHSFENEFFQPISFKVVDKELNNISRAVRSNEKIGIMIEGICEIPNPSLTFGFALYTSEMTPLFWSYHTDNDSEFWPIIKKGKNCLVAWLPTNFLNEGDYVIEMIGGIHYQFWICAPNQSPQLKLRVEGGLSKSPLWQTMRPGILAPTLVFETP